MGNSIAVIIWAFPIFPEWCHGPKFYIATKHYKSLLWPITGPYGLLLSTLCPCLHFSFLFGSCAAFLPDFTTFPMTSGLCTHTCTHGKPDEMSLQVASQIVLCTCTKFWDKEIPRAWLPAWDGKKKKNTEKKHKMISQHYSAIRTSFRTFAFKKKLFKCFHRNHSKCR